MRILLIAFLIIPAAGSAFVDYDRYFTDLTMRVDYIHTGNTQKEFYSLDGIYQEGKWSGNHKSLIDSLDRGGHYVRVYDADTQKLLFSRGYCTLFNEWKTTEQAQEKHMHSMHETVRFPFPRKPVHLVIEARDSKNILSPVFSMDIDPTRRDIQKEKKFKNFRIRKLEYHGDPVCKVDVVILSDGFKKKEMKIFRKSAKRYIEALFQIEPYARRRRDFNVWLVESLSRDSGIDFPGKNVWRDTALGMRYDTFGSPRYLLPAENRSLRDAAARVPYDCIMILTHSDRYGGGGIYNWAGTCYTGKAETDPAWWGEYVFTHEFGHLFAGLGDEYYTSNVAYSEFYPTDVEPWEPNITALLPNQPPKWQDMMTGSPVPTPWAKTQYDSLNAIRGKGDAQAKAKIREKMQHILQNKELKGVVGCFEGAGYTSRGLYRPALDCRMFSKSLVDFCPVCRRAIEEMIDFYTK